MRFIDESWGLVAGVGMTVAFIASQAGCVPDAHPSTTVSADRVTTEREVKAGVSSPRPHMSDCPIRLRDVTTDTGIHFIHTDGSSGRRYIVEPMSTGIATFDYDGDGWIDIYFPNGARLPGSDDAGVPPRHALYRNLGDGRFQDVTAQVGIDCTVHGLGVTIGDFDNDGAPDVFLNNFGPNLLWHNNGDGTFHAVAERIGIAPGDLVGAGACFLDMESDGDLDLYVGNYIKLNCSEHVPRLSNGIPSYPSPRDYAPVADELYRNNGNGTFTDVSALSGIADQIGRSMGMTCADYDNDGDTDLFVCNDVQQNFLFQNDGQGVFQEVASLAGTAYNGNGRTLANMGVDAADYNNDGELDFFTTNYHGSLPVLFHNLGGGLLDDATVLTNAGSGCFFQVNWGCSFVDLDNDGFKDLFIGNGHTEDNIELRVARAAYHGHCVVLRNDAGKFVNVSDVCGDGTRRKLAAKGVAVDDLDNDGDIDVVVLASRERPMILQNEVIESNRANHWLQIQLVGVTSNRDGVGSRVTVSAGDMRLTDEVHSGRGYQSHCGSRLHFGLGAHKHVDQIEIRWNGGSTDVIRDVAADRLMTIIERTGGMVKP